MFPLRVALVGTGRAARALAPLLRTRHAILTAVVGRRAEPARVVADAAVPVPAFTLEDPLPHADWWFIAVSDDAIAEVDGRLAAAGAYQGARMATHASGALPAATLAGAARQGLAVASAHPLAPFAGAVASPEGEAPGRLPFFTLEGDDAAVQVVEAWLSDIGAEHLRVDAASKPLYHAAATAAGNFVVTLLAYAGRLARSAGLPPAQAEAALADLAMSALHNARTLGAAQALTGPIRRGDADTVRAHLNALSERDPRALRLYATLGLETVQLARRAAEPPPGEALAEIEAALKRELRRSG